MFCVVSPDNKALLRTAGESEKESLHRFDMLQPLPWPQAEQLGFRLAEFNMIEVLKNE